jgi:Tol biopolymer transport system component
MKNILKVFILTILFIGIPESAMAQEDEQRFLQGMMKEEGEGNLKEAINIYGQLANDNSVTRTVRAKALLQMGICYEKLGQKNATKAYEKLIAEYGDQKDLIAVAKRKLSFLKNTMVSPKPLGIVSQELTKSIRNVIFSVSPNGKDLANMGYVNGAPEIALFDILTKKQEFVTKGNLNIDGYGSPKRYLPWGAVWTSDSKKVSYVIAYSHIDRKDLRIFDLESKKERILITGRKNNILNNSDSDTDNDDLTKGRIGDMFAFSPDNQKLLFTRNRLVKGDWVHELAEITLDTKKVKVLKTIDRKPGRSIEYKFKYSPNGLYLAYENYSEDTNSTDIFVYDMNNNRESRITNDIANEISPFWSPAGDEIIYGSNNFARVDLISQRVSEGKAAGEPTIKMKDIGHGVNSIGMDRYGALYISKSVNYNELYTVDLNENLDFNLESVQKISLPNLKYSAQFARYSKDGKYISYQTRYSDTYRGFGEIIPHQKYDPALGNKYAIFIYDMTTKNSKFLDIDLYQNHWPRANGWMVPEWSYQEHKLIVNGRSSDYKGGFFEIDVKTKNVTPVLTLPGSKHNDMKLVGQYMRYSKKPDIIYYSSIGWKNAVKYNLKTKEEKIIATMDDGFWFQGFSDEAETIVRAENRFGVYEYDINTHEIKTLKNGGYPHQVFSIPSVNGKNSFIPFKDDQRSGLRILNKEAKSVKELEFSKLFKGHQFQVEDKHPNKDQFLFGFTKEIGKNVYKLNNIFD